MKLNQVVSKASVLETSRTGTNSRKRPQETKSSAAVEAIQTKTLNVIKTQMNVSKVMKNMLTAQQN